MTLCTTVTFCLCVPIDLQRAMYERDDNKMAPYTHGLVHIVQLNIINVLKIM
jgi:hypothetical protein